MRRSHRSSGAEFAGERVEAWRATLRPLATTGVLLALVGSFLIVPSAGADTTPPRLKNNAAIAPPVILSVSSEGLGILVDWSPPPGGVAVNSYELTAKPKYEQGAPSACARTSSLSEPASNTTAIIGNLCEGIAYEVTMTAKNSAGTSMPSAPSNPVVPESAQTPFVPLLTSVFGRQKSLIISWTSPSYDGGNIINKYEVSTTTAGVTKTVSLAPNIRSTSIVGLTDGKIYTVDVRAVNSIGASPASTQSATPSAPYRPGSPTNLSVVPGVVTGTAVVSWLAPKDDGGQSVSSYDVTDIEKMAKKVGKGIEYAPIAGSVPETTLSRKTSVTIHGLKSGNVFYEFRVSSINPVGESKPTAYSSPISATTRVNGNVRVLNAAALKDITDLTPTMVRLHFSSPASVPADIKDVKAKDVIVAGLSPETPSGLLRTVSSVSVSKSTTYTFETAAASLASVFGSMTADVGFAASALASQAAARGAGHFTPTGTGVSVRSLPQVGVSTTLGLALNYSGQVTGADGVVGGSYSVQGEVDITPSLNFNASLLTDEFGIPDGANLSFSASLDTQLSQTTQSSGSISKPFPIGPGSSDFPTTGDTAEGVYCEDPFLVQLGPIPLVLTPCVQLQFVLSVTGQIKVTTSTNYFWGEQISWSSTDPTQLSQTALPSPYGPNGSPITTELDQVEGSFGLSVQPELFLYGITGPYIDATIAFVVDINPTHLPWMTLSVQLSVAAGWQIVIDPLGINVQVQAELTASQQIWASSGDPPSYLLPPLTVLPSSETINPGASQQFSVPNADGAVTWSLSGDADDSISSTGLFTAGSSPGREVTVTATDAEGATGTANVDIGPGLGAPVDFAGSLNSGGNAVNLSWRPPALSAGDSISSYTLSDSPGSQTKSESGSTTSATVSGLAPNTTYTFTLVARDKYGEESPTSTIQVTTPLPKTTPPPPKTVTVTNVSPNQGSSSGDTAVTISGSGFSTTPGATTFSFGPEGDATSVSCSSSSECSAYSPPGTGIVNVVATVLGASSPVVPAQDEYTYVAPPATCATTNGTASLTLDPANVSGLAATIGGEVTVPSGSSLTNLQWSWGDGSISSGCSDFPQRHTYAAAGTYQLTVTATGTNGFQMQQSESVTVTSGGTSTPPPGTTFVPFWANSESEPGGCSDSFTTGYSLSQAIDQTNVGCAWNSSGTVNGVWLHAGTAVTYNFTVPSGTTETVSYGIPSGDYLDNADTVVAVDGVSPMTINDEEGGFGSTAPTDTILWTSAALSSGVHSLTLTSTGNAVNVYGLWITAGATSPPSGTTFVPFWANSESEPGGCSDSFTTGYSLSQAIDQTNVGCAWNSSGTVNGVWLHSGTDLSYDFTVPSGTTETVSYGIPSGDYLNNADAEVSLDGAGPVTVNEDEGAYGATAGTDTVLWTSTSLAAGMHSLTIASEGNAVNVYGLWITSSSTTPLTFDWTENPLSGFDAGAAQSFSISCASSSQCSILGATGSNTTDVWTTTDAGGSWTPSTLPGSTASSFCHQPYLYSCLATPTPESIYAISQSDNGWLMFASSDGGQSWTSSTLPAGAGSGSNPPSISCINASTCYLADWGLGFYGTTDGGANWNQISGNLATVLNSFTTQLVCTNSQTCILGVYGANQQGILFTSDGGATWQQSSSTFPYPTPGEIQCLSPTDCLLASANQLLVSTDGGMTWDQQAEISAAAGQWIVGFSCTSATTCVAAASTGGVYANTVYSTADGQNWTNVTPPSTYCPSSCDGMVNITSVALPTTASPGFVLGWDTNVSEGIESIWVGQKQ